MHTDAHTGLQALYTKYHDKGLEIVGCPCNQVSAAFHRGARQIAQQANGIGSLQARSRAQMPKSRRLAFKHSI